MTMRQTWIREWQIRNFKSVADARIEFAPLTIVVGRNSSGKSSLLQSILLLVQAAQSDAEGALLPLNGELVSLGTESDVVRAADDVEGFSIGGTFLVEMRVPFDAMLARPPSSQAPERLIDVEWEARFRGVPGDAPGSTYAEALRVSLTEDEGRSPLLRLDVQGRSKEEDARAFATNLKEAKRIAPWQRSTRPTLGRGAPLKGSLWTATRGEREIQGVLLAATLPLGVVAESDENELYAREWVARRLDWMPSVDLPDSHTPADVPKRIAELVAPLIEEAVVELHQGQQPQEVPPDLYLRAQKRVLDTMANSRLFKKRVGFNDLTGLVSAVRRGIVDALPPGKRVLYSEATGPLADVFAEVHRLLRSRVVYLGPLREDPQFAYRGTASSTDVGRKGEYTAAVLRAYANSQVEYRDLESGLAKQPLSRAVDYWLTSLGIAEHVETQQLAQFGVAVRVQDSGSVRAVDVTSVGVGISQILPVIVACLLARTGSIVILEQPELHLHPAVQQRLGDFLLAMSASGRQLIVETHSEYMVSRLRRRIAEDQTENTLKLIGMIFAERTAGTTIYRNVEFNPMGGIVGVEWPEGFFDEGATEAQMILRAALKKHDRTQERA